jgi:hypothetical protein
VNHGTDRNLIEREAVADLGSDTATGLDLLAYLKALRSDDIPLLSIGILNKSDTSAAVRIVLDGKNLCRLVVFVTKEIDDTVHLLVSATDITHGHLTSVVASASPLKRLKQ